MNTSVSSAKNLLIIGLAIVLGIALQSCSQGDEPEIVTPPDNGEEYIPEGALPGVFTVGIGVDGIAGTEDDVKVRFSKGNLYYDGTQSKYFFESKQYDVPPLTSNNETENHVGHFFWSQSAAVAISLSNYTDSGASTTDVFFTNDSNGQTKPSSSFTVNGQTGFWRVLSGGANGEWEYIVNKDDVCGTTVRSGKYKYGVTVCGQNYCLILLPDDWKWDENTVGTDWQDGGYPETSNDKVTWQTMEAAGAVCLPAAGFRFGYYGNANVLNVGDGGDYWSASPSSDFSAYGLGFNSGDVNPSGSVARDWAQSVRLVTESK